jgi:PhnB protein
MAKPIPDGFHSVTPYLIISGADKAIDFYKKAFGASELFRMPGPDGRLMHAEIKLGDSIIMIAEAFPEWGSPAVSANNHIYVQNADAFFATAVSAGAKALMPVQEMFWGDRFGKLADPFGQTWSVATHVKDMTPQEMAEAGKKAMANADCGKK